MVSKENLMNLVTRQAIMKPFLYKDGLRKIKFLEDSVMSTEKHEEFKRFNNIIEAHKIFCGTDSELDNLKELINLLEAM